MIMRNEFTTTMARRSTGFFRMMVAAGTLVISPGGAAAHVEGTVLVPKNLATARERLERGDPALRPSLTALIGEADRLLSKVPPAVVEKTVEAPSGDKHDYFSVSPCWWPDPVQPKGRPYAWRDGAPNPGNRAGRIDPGSFGRMCDSVETLALAYHFTGRERYAKKAAQFLHVWFLDPASRMSPHLRYADTVPGRPTRLSNGIFEFRQVVGLLDAVCLLRDSYAWPAVDQAAFKTWLADYYHWLTASEQGMAGRAMPNHPGSWYDVQTARIAVALGRNDEASAIVKHALDIRVGLQIQPDGSQPLELARANPLACSITNVEALVRLGFLADELGIEWWQRAPPDGGGVAAALKYLAPFADPKINWPAASVRESERDHLRRLLTQARQRLAPSELTTTLVPLSALRPNHARWHLLWP
ncbi:MAG: alginate lyase [Opitutus sp.]|nr:alginate lyase [Opitutus sp.]